MAPEELMQELEMRVDNLTDEQLEDLKNYFILVHANRNKSEAKVAVQDIISGMEQVFSQLDEATVTLMKQKIKGEG